MDSTPSRYGQSSPMPSTFTSGSAWYINPKAELVFFLFWALG